VSSEIGFRAHSYRGDGARQPGVPRPQDDVRRDVRRLTILIALTTSSSPSLVEPSARGDINDRYEIGPPSQLLQGGPPFILMCVCAGGGRSTHALYQVVGRHSAQNVLLPAIP
jgi:hypothetical protein